MKHAQIHSELRLRCAVESDAAALTQISFAAKGFWNYPPEYMQKWANELTITTDYIKYNRVICAELNHAIVGFYSVFKMDSEQHFGNVYLEEGYWLDHMFILPQFHKMGIGRCFIDNIDQFLNESTPQKRLRIFVDPNAVGFYEKIGAKQIRISESSIPNRLIPVYEYAAKGSR